LVKKSRENMVTSIETMISRPKRETRDQKFKLIVARNILKSNRIIDQGPE
jgi:hypothetical protein